MADSDSNRFGSARGAEFPHDGGNMEFGGMLGNGQPRCNFLISQSAREHLQYFAFSVCQWLGKLR